MKFQYRDTVKIINAIEKRYIGLVGNIVDTPRLGELYTIQFPNSPDYRYFNEQDLELVEHKEVTTQPETPQQIRTFDTGATRDTIEGKLDYVKALCPLVLRRYVQYLDKHRLQPNGSMRDFNNWKKGIPQETYHSSKGRHFFASWLLEEGYKVSDNHGPVNEEDALCGELFNTMGKLREILRAKLVSKKKFVVPEGWEVIKFTPGWFVYRRCSDTYLHKNGKIYPGGQIGTGKESWHGYAEAPGYWPTEEAAKDALKQYLAKGSG